MLSVLGAVMEIILSQFIKSLTESGLMTAEEVYAFLDSLPPEKKPNDGAALARALVRRGNLTKFQAQAIHQGKTRGLILGNYVILDRIGQGGMGQVYKAGTQEDGTCCGSEDSAVGGYQVGTCHPAVSP